MFILMLRGKLIR